MPANVYECLFLLDPTKVSGDVPAAAQQLHTLLERNGAEMLASRPWDERRLAYTIKKHKKGLYYLTYFRVDAKNLANMERDFHLNEMILRFLFQLIDPKMVDIMLEMARDEHAMALQTVTEPPDGDLGGDGDRFDGGDRGGRRGGRRPAEARD